MEDNRRLILDATVSDTDAVGADTSDTQSISAATPGEVENTAALAVSLPAGGAAVDTSDSLDADADPLILPASVQIVDGRITSVSLDTRIASSRWTAAEVGGQSDQSFAMTSNLRRTDQYLTIVDMYGRGQPGVHHLLKEGGSGFITFENGNRILII